jgi:hypothetical protein
VARVSPVLAPLVGLPEVSVGVSFSADEDVSFDGVGTTSSWDPEWAVGLTCRWRRFEADPAEGEALRAGRHRLAVAAEVARLWAAQARPVVAVTLLDQVHAALRVAEIDARLRALEEEP